MDVLQEEIHQFVPFLLLVLDKSGGGSFTKELHQTALHHDPEHTGKVKQECKEDFKITNHKLHEKCNLDPTEYIDLIIRIVRIPRDLKHRNLLDTFLFVWLLTFQLQLLLVDQSIFY